MHDAVAKFLQRSRRQPKRKRDLYALAEVKTVQRGLLRKSWMFGAIFADPAAQVAAQRRNRKIIADVERGQLLGQIFAAGVRVSPLREVIRKSFRKEVMDAQRLKSVMKDGGVATFLKPLVELGHRACGLISNTRQVRDGEKLERCFRNVHANVLYCSTNSVDACSKSERSKDRALGCLISISEAPR